MTPATRRAALLAPNIADGREILCQEINAVFRACEWQRSSAVAAINNNNSAATPVVNNSAVAPVVNDSAVAPIAPVVAVTATPEMRQLEIWKTSDMKRGLIVSKVIKETMERFALYTDATPRRLKHVVNTIQVISEVARLKVISEENTELRLNNDDMWPIFSQLIVKWVFLCENYPYRMSFLVLVMTDIDQKKRFNEIVSGASPGSLPSYESRKTGAGEIQLDEDECIASFYFRHVERLIYALPCAEKLMRMDADPELFATALMLPVQHGSTQTINVSNVLGPLSEQPDADRGINELPFARNADFSLLSYSFNLCPALRVQIVAALSGVMSDYEMNFKASDRNADAPVVAPRSSVLPPSSVIFKMRHLTEVERLNPVV